ncbi:MULTISPECIES: 4Fe-4S dicluster domain-containing protein [Desulfosediminicola]|uniref:4Fe-4S dicluster domain-containing protein n=1 Tax=Desulfosediminicola TaxID=2886823 RepID=UPI0010AC4A05|nr:4Fe-4S dicluster domain-containing protein [Desulfosediminicola ganghwensis]
MNAFVVADAGLCIGCQACMIACAKAHSPAGSPESGQTTGAMAAGRVFQSRITLVRTAEVTVPVQCRHCENSPCANVCPVDAIVQKDACIDIVEKSCVGCKSCMLACPYGAIQVVADDTVCGKQAVVEFREKTGQDTLHVVVKCDLCFDHGSPACVKICPAGALRLVEGRQLSESIVSKRRAAAGRMGRIGSQH